MMNHAFDSQALINSKKIPKFMHVHTSGAPPIFIGKHTRSHSGVSEINDARHILSQTWTVTSRTLDFNVVGMRALRVYIKRHLFRSPEHSPSCPTTATLTSGGRGFTSDLFSSGVIFFANTGIPKRGLE